MKNINTSNLIKICPVEAQMSHVDGQRDRLTHKKRPGAAFHNFAKAPKKRSWRIL